MNKFESTFNISITQMSLLTIYKSSHSKDYNYFICYQNSSISIDKIYYYVYANAQSNLCAKRLCGHQPCYHLVLIR